MKKAISLLLALVLLGTMTACGAGSTPATQPQQTAAETTAPAAETTVPTEAAEPTEVVVFAAASLTETLTRIAEDYKKAAPNVTLTFNFDSSGTLKTQIQEGADCDLFISAGQKQMNQLDKSSEANTEGLDFVEADTRVNLLENKVALVAPEGNPKEIRSYEDLAEKLKAGTILMAMGNSDVPVGQYTQKILAYFELDEAALANAGTLSYGTNVKEVVTQVKEASVDCGVVYSTDAFSAGLTVLDTATKEMCGQVIYPAAVLKTAKQAAAAADFLQYLRSDAAMGVFEAVGFAAVK